jgi:cell division protein ZapE
MIPLRLMHSAPNGQIIKLSERDAAVAPEELLEHFEPPPRFAAVRFANYRPNQAFDTQSDAKSRLEAFVLEGGAKKSFSWFGLAKPKAALLASVYLDGGFGVGKTHLLAATWHEFDGPKYFLSFAELVFAIGALGMEKAVPAFQKAKLLCIDEFELDDVGNTLVVSRFLGRLIPLGTRVVTTSNTLPTQLGLGRFNADDFKREIQMIAGHFDALRIDGPDYRHREGLPAPHPCDASTLQHSFQAFAGVKALEDFKGLNAHLGQLHPIRYAGLLEGLDAVFVRDLEPIQKQDDALRFVHFVDKLYDREVKLLASGCELEALFPDSYRSGGYAKKYARCLSRLGELLREGTGDSEVASTNDEPRAATQLTVPPRR